MSKAKTKKEDMRKSRVVLTGGHAATTALSTIEALWSLNPDLRICWIGSKYALEGDRAVSLEFKTLPSVGVRCYAIISGRLQRRWTRYTLLSLAKVPLGFVHALLLIFLVRPGIVVSFGGFAAFPVVVCAWALRIPVIIHEQTAAAGLANRLSVPFSRKIAIARESSREFFPKEKTILVGNPVRREFFAIKPKASVDGRPVIFATGGSRGAKNLNQAIFDLVPALVEEYFLIHLCGEFDFHRAKRIRNSLPVRLRKRYEVYSTISPFEMPGYFSKADVVIGRSGANTVAEVIASRRRAIFVPIPWAQSDEQTINAQLATKEGLAKIITQAELTSGVLLSLIKEILAEEKKFNKKSAIRDLDMHAAVNLAKIITELAK